MNRFLYFYFLLLICNNSHAQKIKDEQLFIAKGLVDVAFGVAIPTLDYGLTKPTLPAGYAKPGYTFKLGMNYDLASFLGLAFQYQYANNPYNASDLLQDLQASNSLETYNSFRSNAWELNGVLLGMYYPFRSYKTAIDLRLLGGMFTGVFPESVANFTIPTLNNLELNIKTLESTATNFGYQAGIKIRYQLTQRFMLSGGIDYTQTTIEFNDLRAIETNYNIPVTVNSYTQKFQLITVSTGVGIAFN